METTAAPGARLRALVAGDGAAPAGEGHRCELCSAPVPADHPHVLEVAVREPRCACRPCALLFDHPAAAGERYRVVPDRRLRLSGFVLDDPTWAAMGVPVQMAYAYRDSGAGRTVVCYPSPAGAVEASVDAAVWAAVEEANPVLGDLVPDVEALLIDRAVQPHGHWLVPIGDCYSLVALLRTRWKGLSGGPDVWAAVADFRTELHGRARPVDRQKGVPG